MRIISIAIILFCAFSSYAGETRATKMAVKDGGTNMEVVTVKGGCFRMGNAFDDNRADERPVHEICVDDFNIGKYEVTNGQYKIFKPDHDSSSYEGRTLNSDDQPVVEVSWDDAVAYAKWLSVKTGRLYRLPTEAEWEFASRSGGKREKYSGGSATEGGKSNPVGQGAPNGLGIYDMNGNVCEWVSDWYDARYYEKSPKSNPLGPSAGIYRVVRGGSWLAGVAHSTLRNWLRPSYRLKDVGFRLVIADK